MKCVFCSVFIGVLIKNNLEHSCLRRKTEPRNYIILFYKHISVLFVVIKTKSFSHNISIFVIFEFSFFMNLSINKAFNLEVGVLPDQQTTK